MRWQERLQEIRQAARILLEQTQATSLPIPIDRVAKHLGARIRHEPYQGDLSGLLYRNGEDIVIGINTLHPETRQRFTIAHEIGHLVCHIHETLHIDRRFATFARDELSSQAVDKSEIEANAFAAEILMPIFMLQQEIRNYDVDYEDDDFIRRLSRKYGVSLQAMTFRLANIGFIDPATTLT